MLHPTFRPVRQQVLGDRELEAAMSVARFWQLSSLLIVSSSKVFSASNFCPRTENYTITSMETYTEPVVVNTFTWCLQIPPRCPKTRTEMRQRYRVKTESKTRIVNECCEGYKMISSGDNETGIRCMPLCEKCLSGVCVSPNECQCNPGYRGDNCAIACPLGTWGSQCKEKCNCTEGVPCSPATGRCAYPVCPPGLRGKTCNESCPSDRWGPNCTFLCNCKTRRNECHSESGRCTEDHNSVNSIEHASYSPNLNRASKEPLHITESNEESSFALETMENTTGANHEDRTTMDNLRKATSQETTTSTPDHLKIRTQPQEEDGSNTARPVIVLVSVPERRRNLEEDRTKFAMKTPFLRHVVDNVNLHDIGLPQTDYVKNIHKDEVSSAPIPLDVALIVVASIVSLGLTSVAVVMILHIRSKLFEAARISIYEEGKAKTQENANTGRISTIITSALPQTPIRVNPAFTSASEPGMMLAILNSESSNSYANGAGTIGHRISSNLHDLPQEDHYDRPPATRIRLQTDIESEHIYDEIPLQSSPLRPRKNA